MRIAVLGPYPVAPGKPVGGVQAAVASLAESLTEVGEHQVRVIDPFTGYPPVESSDVDVIRLRRLSPWRSGLRSVPRPLRHTIAEYSPDVLHVHLGAQYTSAHPVSVLTVHGFPHLESRLRNPGPRGWLASYVLARSFRWGVIHARKIIAISDEVARAAAEAGVASISVPNPVAREFYEVKRQESGDFLAIGEIMRRKNQVLLIQAFGRYVQEGGAGNLLLVGGVGDHRYLEECLKAARGHQDRVAFVGPVNRQQLVQLLSGARASISTSLRETSSIALAESLAANCPVVSLDVGTARSQVRSPEAGVVLPKDATVEEVSDAFRQVSTLPPGNPRHLVISQHPLAVARQTLQVYRSALRGDASEQ